MIIAFDTNVLLDAFAEREGAKEAQELILAVAEDKVVGLVGANSITDIFYLLRKAIGIDGAKEAVLNILNMFDVAPLNGEDCFAALTLPMNDFEDAVLAVCAAKENADWIVSRDKGFINADSPVPVATPEKILGILE